MASSIYGRIEFLLICCDLLGHNGQIMLRSLPIGKVKARFAECVRMAESGDTIVLTRHGRPVARITAFGSERRPGQGNRPDLGGEVREPAEVYEASPGPPPTSSDSASLARREALERFLEERVWPRIPAELLGKGVSKREREEILGSGSSEA